jgi:5-methylthioadenosine/S-adenosylhomocysteine deaminase
VSRDPPTAIDLLVHAGWVIPVEPAGVVIEGGALAVQDGRIVDVGASALLAGRYAPREQVRFDRRHALLPGFVNAHTHAALALLRGAPLRAPPPDWFTDRLGPGAQRWVGPEFVRAGTREAIAQMIRRGITCFGDMYLFPDEVGHLAEELRIRVGVGLPVAEAPSAWAGDAREYLERAVALWDAFKSDPWVRPYFAADGLATLGPDTLARLRRTVDQLDAPLAAHVHEVRTDVDAFAARTGSRPFAAIAAAGLLRPGFIAIHAIHVEEAELDLAARAGISIVHCPRANARLGSGVAPLQSMRRRGLPVALGTDGGPGLGAPDLLAEARLAALLASARERSAGAVGAHDALRMASLEGAVALGLGAETGSLCAGKSADFIVIDLGDAPADAVNVAGCLVYDASTSRVTDAWIAGSAHLRGGRLMRIDPAELAASRRQWSALLGLPCEPSGPAEAQ